ncbi:hypothetical protein KQI30_11130 [Clostridium bornimense]|uniref:hypothetical protein n=1 Tax=Clostridium bornimense TaxID=1216932 RepID=UPI001C0FB238|nr:hypothetical protein [Clostridium bornimense]MBU5316818.1 hypothetical protein [Clostridium bornimense]
MKYEIKYEVEKNKGTMIEDSTITIDTLNYKENSLFLEGIKRKILRLPSTSWLASMEDVKIVGIDSL